MQHVESLGSGPAERAADATARHHHCPCRNGRRILLASRPRRAAVDGDRRRAARSLPRPPAPRRCRPPPGRSWELKRLDRRGSLPPRRDEEAVRGGEGRHCRRVGREDEAHELSRSLAGRRGRRPRRGRRRGARAPRFRRATPRASRSARRASWALRPARTGFVRRHDRQRGLASDSAGDPGVRVDFFAGIVAVRRDRCCAGLPRRLAARRLGRRAGNSVI